MCITREFLIKSISDVVDDWSSSVVALQACMVASALEIYTVCEQPGLTAGASVAVKAVLETYPQRVKAEDGARGHLKHHTDAMVLVDIEDQDDLVLIKTASIATSLLLDIAEMCVSQPAPDDYVWEHKFRYN